MSTDGAVTVARGRAAASVTSLLLAVACIGSAVMVVVNQYHYRMAEARVSAWVAERVLNLTTWMLPDRPALLFGPGDTMEAGVSLSLACSTALLVTPILLISGLLLLSASRSRARILLATAAAVAVLLVANVIRMVMIIEFTHQWGSDGMEWAHVLLGSVLMMLLGAAALLTYVRISTGRGLRRRAQQAKGVAV